MTVLRRLTGRTPRSLCASRRTNLRTTHKLTSSSAISIELTLLYADLRTKGHSVTLLSTWHSAWPASAHLPAVSPTSPPPPSLSQERPLPLSNMHHVSRVCRDVDASRRFYRDLLGMVEVRRPSSLVASFEGAWLLGSGIGVHLIQGMPPPRSKVINPRSDHVSFHTDDVDAVARELDQRGVPFVRAFVQEGGFQVSQIFIHDPDENMIELCNCGSLPTLPLDDGAGAEATCTPCLAVAPLGRAGEEGADSERCALTRPASGQPTTTMSEDDGGNEGDKNATTKASSVVALPEDERRAPPAPMSLSDEARGQTSGGDRGPPPAPSSAAELAVRPPGPTGISHGPLLRPVPVPAAGVADVAADESAEGNWLGRGFAEASPAWLTPEVP